jgi:hypothetical protein
VQSLDPEVQRNIRRSNVDAEYLNRLADQANVLGANSHAEVILGLPGDSVEKHFKSIEGLIDAGFSEVRMYQLMLLPGAEVSAASVRRRFGIKTHWRVIPRSFGDYEVDSATRVVAAEVEEIVTSLDTLSFDDYLRCRRFNLMVNLFYNDGVFLGPLKVLSHLGIPRSEWIRSLFAHELPGQLESVIGSFVRETREELWGSREELLAFTRKRENIGRFLREELGSNLILKYKVLMRNDRLHELADLAKTTILEVLDRRDQRTPDVEALVDDALTFEVMRKADLWKGDYEPHEATLRFDVEKFLSSPDSAPLCEFFLPQPQNFRFALTDDQIAIIERSLNAYGRGLAGMGRIYTRVHVRKLNRGVVPV